MSGDASSQSGSDEEDLLTTGLIATRAKRSTAGNLYATLRQNLDDEELQKELLAEDEEDVGDYEGSDRDGDSDEAMESSSDDEDAGPPKNGEAEELDGERELKKMERADARKKKKLEQAKLRVPSWQKKKRVELADDVTTEDGAPERPKKRSERASWLPAGLDAPIRQSERASAVANREITHAHLKQSAARSEKQRKVMKNAAQRDRANKRAQLTQEERLAKATKIEKETSREFGRWEREEAERQRIRDEQLAAKRRRGFEGPFVRYWSGSVLWEGEKIRVKRLHGSRSVDEIEDELDKKDANEEIAARAKVSEQVMEPTSIKSSFLEDQLRTSMSAGLTSASEFPDKPSFTTSIPPTSTSNPAGPDTSTTLSQIEQPILSQTGWLEGIHEYAAQSVDSSHIQSQPETAPSPSHQAKQPPYMPSAPSIHNPELGLNLTQIPQAQQPLPSISQQPHAPQPQIPHQQTPRTYHGWHPGYQQFSLQPPPPPPQAPPIPLIREQAQRSLILLEQFEKLNTAATSKRSSSRSTKETLLEPSPLASTLFSTAYPTFGPDESRYLTAKMRKRGQDYMLPTAPAKTRCAITSWPAKFRDPKTGLPYAELQTYKVIQRLLAGGCAWSGVLGAWVGPAYGTMGRPAKDVPEGFAAAAPQAPKSTGEKAEVEGGGEGGQRS